MPPADATSCFSQRSFKSNLRSFEDKRGVLNLRRVRREAPHSCMRVLVAVHATQPTHLHALYFQPSLCLSCCSQPAPRYTGKLKHPRSTSGPRGVTTPDSRVVAQMAKRHSRRSFSPSGGRAKRCRRPMTMQRGSGVMERQCGEPLRWAGVGVELIASSCRLDSNGIACLD